MNYDYQRAELEKFELDLLVSEPSELARPWCELDIHFFCQFNTITYKLLID